MAKWAILEVSDGTTTVILISGSKTGFHLRDWNPQVIQPKEGGVFQDSPIAPGRRLVYAVDATAIESLTIDVNNYDQDGLIEQAQDLMRLLLKARAYQSTEFQDEPVYIRARSDCETNDRFALIINWAIPQLDNPYAQPFETANEITLMDDLNLQLERGHWLALAPGQGECVEISTLQNWEYQAQWVVSSTAPTAGAYSLLQAANGYIYAGDNGQIIRSINDGGAWAVNTTLPADIVYALFQAQNSYIYAGDNGQILRTIDNGANWTVVTTSPVNFVQAFAEIGGYILAGDTNQIWRSADNGGSWAAVALPSPSGEVRGFIVDGRTVYLAAETSFMRSTDNGASWTIISQIATRTGISIYSVAATQDRSVFYIGSLAAAGNGEIFKSVDHGETWTLIPHTFSGTTLFSILVEADGSLYVGDDLNIVFSPDSANWVIVFGTPGAPIRSLLRATEPALYAGGGTGGNVYKNDLTYVALGAEDACDDIPYAGNRHNVANLTHVKIDDGGVFTDIFPMVSFPTTLYPASMVVGDALYFGIESAIVDSGPFSGLVFDIATPIPPTISYTITWEYWSGAAWSALTVRDGTNDGAGSFTHSGICSVHWEQPSNWATTAVNGVTALWVRARVSAKAAGTLTPPTQQSRQIYAVNSAFIDTSDVLGDVPAIIQIKLNNRSDFDGAGSSAPNLYANRIIAGLRSAGANFHAYLNISDEQNPPGVTALVGVNTTFVADNTTPTGRRATYNPTGVEGFGTRATVILGPTAARDYYGTFHFYLRARRTGGASTDFTVKLEIDTGSGGITFTSHTVQLQTTTAFEVLDFGEISLPVSGSFKSTDLPDQVAIRIMASAANSGIDLYLYDLILIPVDEWAIDAVDVVNGLSEVGRSGGIPKLLDVDSITDPRIDIKTLVRTANANEYITADWNPITNGPAILQANVEQKLWFFAMLTSTTGTPFYWLAPPEIAHSVQILKNERYLGQRGSR